MKRTYKIIPDLQARNALTIHPTTARRQHIPISKKWYLRFGMQVLEINLNISSKINENEVKLSVDIIEWLRIPINGTYELRRVANELIVGPYLGLLTTSKKSSLDETVQYLSNYLYDYDHIGGAIVAFSLEGIHTNDHTIEGYLYNPDTKKWESGVYSYPASVFKTIYLNKKWRNYFQRVFGQRFFNSYIFNKWEMYQWLTQNDDVKTFLPYTVLYKRPKDLEATLNRYDQIFVKPVHGSMGERIYKVTKLGEQNLKLEYSQDGTAYTMTFKSVYDLDQYFLNRFKGKKVILQEALDLISFDGKNIDFRIVLVKDQAGEWNDMCMVAKYGQKGSIITNILAGGTAEIGEVTLQKIFNLSPNEVFAWRKEISELVKKTAQCIEQCGVHCGNLGIDIAIDHDQRVWILEVNNLNPSPLFALDIHNRPLFYEIKRMNLLYAKNLAGFPEELT
jgi:glutathione synthase/RimK-type ligase-like ATP-grasp enzyme